ncbi:DUF1242-domain-containing protein [Gymnopus androsaceus JB14]|uniref:DUF1242-domain-containing protein n=1 Tax=Gymnopus androsaceus JB14 TaxID=1447944 RepID=A0A6A4GXH9_9AGAR|nr:DUF1242-domain-containing protein [Gymnopus androsaceus JB14]
MSALFNFQSLLLVILLMICTCTYVRAVAPRLVDRNKEGFLGLFFMAARIAVITIRCSSMHFNGRNTSTAMISMDIFIGNRPMLGMLKLQTSDTGKRVERKSSHLRMLGQEWPRLRVVSRVTPPDWSKFCV